MKGLYILIISSGLVCSKQYPDSAEIICSRAECMKLVTDNNLNITFSFSSFHYFHRRIGVGIYCNVRNDTKQTLVLDRRLFGIESKFRSYPSEPFSVSDNLRIKVKPDSLLLPPGEMIDYVFAYNTDLKYSKKEYEKLIRTDTVNFFYQTAAGKQCVFKMIVPPEE